nr:AsmA family protein [uncultured Hyphomonas sp.]
MKRTILILAGVFGLLLVAALTVPFFVPKSVYKAEIEKAATNALNRDVQLTGDVSVSVFPRISARVGGVTVANPDGFSTPNMIEAGELRGSVKWLPLLSRRVEVQELSFVDANVQLEKLADGRTNWDFGTSSDAEQPAPASEGGGVSASIGKASLKNASLTYTDRAAGTEYALKDLNLDASMQGFDKPLKAKADGIFQDQAFDIDLTLDTLEQLQNGSPATVDAKFDSKLATGTFDGSVTLGDAPALDGTFSLDAPNLAEVAKFASIELPVNIAPLGAGNMKGSVSGPFDALTIKFDNLDLKSDLVDLGFTGSVALKDSPVVDGQLQASASNTGELLKQMGIEVPAEDALEKVNITGKVSGPADALSLTGLDIKHSGALLNASYKGQASLAGDGSIKGTIDASSNELRALLKAADVEMPEGDTMKTFSTAGDISGSFKKLSISDLKFALDNIRATGTAGLDLSGTKPHVSGDLDMGELDLSPFLAAEDQEKKPQQPMEGWSKEPLDLAGLKAVDADLKIKTTTLTLGNVVLKDATVIATLRNGKLNADLPTFNAFGGNWGGKMSLDASVPKPALSLDMTGNSIGISSLLGTLAGFDRLTGTGSFAVSATSTGTSIDQIMKDLNGEISTKLNDGAIKGLNIAQLVRSKDSLLQAVTSGKLQNLDFASALSPEAKTDFSSFDTVLSVRNGIATVDLMKLISPILGVDGTGDINLGGQTLDLRLATSIDKKGQGSGSVVQLNGVPVPIRLSGSWYKPKVTPDLSGVTKQLKQDLAGQLLEGLTGKSGSSGANPLADILGTSTGSGKTETPSTETETKAPAKQETPEDLAEQAAKEALGNLLFGKKKTEDKPNE